jgi:hypothetical protein
MITTAKRVALIALISSCAITTIAATPLFQPQTRVGFTVGDQWEPSIAADRYGHVYILIPQYTNASQTTIPTCPTCSSPTMFLIVSNDNGTTWSAPKIIYPPGSGQIDVQIKVDPVDGQTVLVVTQQFCASHLADDGQPGKCRCHSISVRRD